MSHYSLFAIGFEDEEELEEMMSFYDENLKTAPYVYKTKEDIIELGKKKYKEKCRLIESYSTEPEKTIEEYGIYVKELYENRDKDGMFNYYKDPEDYYKWFVSGQKTDRNGNLLSNDNPNSKWNYYSVERETTVTTPKGQPFFTYQFPRNSAEVKGFCYQLMACQGTYSKYRPCEVRRVLRDGHRSPQIRSIPYTAHE